MNVISTKCNKTTAFSSMYDHCSSQTLWCKLQNNYTVWITTFTVCILVVITTYYFYLVMKLSFTSVEMWTLRAMGTVEIPLKKTVSLHYVEVHVSNVMSTTMINGPIWWSETKISHNETHILTPLFEYLFTYKRICAILSARHHQQLMLQTIPSTFFKFIHSVVCLITGPPIHALH